MEFMGWEGTVSEPDFRAYQAKSESGELTVDEVAGSWWSCRGSRRVLALFGEKDTNVDWRATSKLIECHFSFSRARELWTVVDTGEPR